MNKGLKAIQACDRPREKMRRKGVKALSNPELLAVILGSGTRGKDVLTVARDVLRRMERNPAAVDPDTLGAVAGIGPVRAGRIIAAMEFARRYWLKDGVHIRTVRDILAQVNDLREKRQEYFVTLTLDGAGHLIQKRVVFIGTLNESIIHPREVFSDAVNDRAATVVLVHNHPGGTAHPSGEDAAITTRLAAAGSLLGIDVFDHLIVTRREHFSFRAAGLL